MNSRSMAGWIGFAGILMVILGGLSFFEGLIALLRDNYYVVTRRASCSSTSPAGAGSC